MPVSWPSLASYIRSLVPFFLASLEATQLVGHQSILFLSACHRITGTPLPFMLVPSPLNVSATSLEANPLDLRPSILYSSFFWV
jgi:hypothetical protein